MTYGRLAMKSILPLTVIVPEPKGIEVLKAVPGIEAALVSPTQDVPASLRSAGVLVVGPAEQPSEVENALRQIAQLPGLRLLQTLGQGVEQWDGLLPAGLTVSTARGAHGASTAEWVLTALLALTRDIPRYIKNQQVHQWEGRRARTLQNAQILVYGSGDLGRNIGSRLLSFGAHVTMVGTHSREGVVDSATARDLLPKVAAVILALPLTPATRNIVDARFLGLLADGAIVINAGRGGLVDQTALLEELSRGRLTAALDVVTPEPLPSDSPLWDAPGVLLTPHIGGNTDGADDRAWKVASEKIRAFVNGDEPKN
jgi:phosphoglycerate dehydrogenase-like enzyme